MALKLQTAFFSMQQEAKARQVCSLKQTLTLHCACLTSLMYNMSNIYAEILLQWFLHACIWWNHAINSMFCNSNFVASLRERSNIIWCFEGVYQTIRVPSYGGRRFD